MSSKDFTFVKVLLDANIIINHFNPSSSKIVPPIHFDPKIFPKLLTLLLLISFSHDNIIFSSIIPLKPFKILDMIVSKLSLPILHNSVNLRRSVRQRRVIIVSKGFFSLLHSLEYELRLLIVKDCILDILLGFNIDFLLTQRLL